MRPSLTILVIVVAFAGCKKQKAPNVDVAIYLLKSFATVNGNCQVNGGTALLQDLPLANNSDIISYSPASYQYQLSDAAIQKVKTLDERNAFAVTVDKKVIYYGLVKLNIFSSSCDHSITMDIMWASSNKIQFNLGYPGQLPGSLIDDQRNNSALVAALQAQGKLK